MKSLIKKLIMKLITNRFAHWYTVPIENHYQQLLQHARLSYSQEGEDLLLFEILGHQSLGFYVDIGAHHPKHYSNTYFFYQRGWRGINVDAAPGSMAVFFNERPEDTNLEIGITTNEKIKTFYIFNEPSLNTFDSSRALEVSKIPSYKIVEQVNVPTTSFEKLMDQYLPKGTEIDFLNIDIEGLDYEVLKSNNWKKYRPRFIVVENFIVDIKDVLNTDIYSLLTENGYLLTAKTYRNFIFMRR